MSKKDLADELQKVRFVTMTDLDGLEWRLRNVDRQTIINALRTLEQVETELIELRDRKLAATIEGAYDPGEPQPLVPDDPDDWRDYADEPDEEE